MKKYNFMFIVTIVIISFGMNFCLAKDTDNISKECFTPEKGTQIRKDILDVLRQEVKSMHGVDVVFVVEHLKVQDGWAWVHAFPQSPDGMSRYEDINALFKLQNGDWKIVELPCAEEENPECLGDLSYFLKLKQRFPDMPEEILPEE
ncbi:MAG: hypothetical protein PHV08_00825 [Sulfurovaceae bacterium]|jgi:hypothetical protein|nr:hypothetical protein [Sulfurovaceae bacterium]